MAQQITLREWIENYDNGLYDRKDVRTQIDAGWFDWFCQDTALCGRLKKMAARVKKIAKSRKVNPDTTYVFFANNLPMSGRLYDSFSLADIETEQVLYWVAPPTKERRAEVWASKDRFQKAAVRGTWEDVETYFGLNKSAKTGAKLGRPKKKVAPEA